MESTVALSFDQIELVLTFGTPHHGSIIELWVSWLEISQEEYFLGL